MEGLDLLIGGKICPKEDVAGDTDEVIHDGQGRRYGAFPLQTAVDQRLVDCNWH